MQVFAEQVEQLAAQNVYRIRFSVAHKELERGWIISVLKHCKGNACRAARILGQHRNTIGRKIKEFEIDLEGIRDGNTFSMQARHFAKKGGSL